MYEEPAGLDRRHVTDTLQAEWEIPVESLQYDPVGFGTHHYVAQSERGKWFVNVDELAAKTWLGCGADQAYEGLSRALQTAFDLRSSGLEFVHGPTARIDGGVLARVGGEYAISVYSFIEGRPGAYDEALADTERRTVLSALGRLHAATATVPRDLPRCDAVSIPLRERLNQALEDPGSTWTGGPFSESARLLLLAARDSVRELLEAFDGLADVYGTPDESWVITHGEPHTANIIWTQSSFALIDWDTVALGPPERDLWMLPPRSDDEWNAYTSSGGAAVKRPDALELFRLWWSLAEIAGYVDLFRSPHQDDANTRVAWTNLQEYVPGPDGAA